MSEKEYYNVSFKGLFENAGNAAIIILDKEGVILGSNKGMERSYGYQKPDLQGKHFSLLYTRENQLTDAPKRELADCMQKGFSSDENYVIHKDGSLIWSHGETVFTKNKDNEIRLVKLIYDINQQKLLETSLLVANQKLLVSKDQVENANKELSLKNAELLEVNQELDTFVYTASHDLKGPINNIEALISVIEGGLVEECREKVHEEMDLLHESVEKFKLAINDLSENLSRKEQKGKNTVHFAEILKEVKMSLYEEVENTKAVFVEDFGQAPFIKFSRKHLRSILYNLISNSIKYHYPERTPEIGVSTTKDNGFIKITVSDNGMGMNEEQKEQVFNMYKRFQTHVEGSGVGMGIVKKIVENYDGKVEVESEEGKGSSFKIYLKETS